MKYKPLGARLLVQPIVTTLSLEERARNAGLEIVVEQENRPMPTQGVVVAVGSDPLLQEEIKRGDLVFFNKHAGHDVELEGQSYRQLEHQEVTGVVQESDLEEPQSRPDTPANSAQPTHVGSDQR